MSETYSLNGHLDSVAAPPLATELLELRGKPVCVDASTVSFAGTLLVQVLVAARKQWHDDGQDFRIAPLSRELANAARGLGVELSSIGANDVDVLTAEATA